MELCKRYLNNHTQVNSGRRVPAKAGK